MPKKIIVIGANHAGTAALNTILDNYKDVDVTAFDANSNISFLGCGMALWIGGQISGPDGLFYSSKEILEGKGAKIYMETSVNSVDFDSKVVYTKDAASKDCEYPYDKLILATGSTPVGPQLPGMSLENVQFVKLYQNAAEVIEKLGDTSLIDCADTCLSAYYDDMFCKRMEKQLSDHGIHLAFEEKVERLEGNEKVEKVVTDKHTYDADMVIFCVGFRPNTKLGNSQLKQFHNNGAYLTDLMQQTSRPDVYAVGDCATVYNNAIEDTDYIALATNAVRSGIIAAHNACGTELKSPGVQGSNGISIWGLNMVSTGLSLERAKKLGFDAAATDYEDWQKAGFMEKDNYKVVIRIVYDKKTRRILGAQLCSDYDISMAIHLFSMAIQEKVTIDKLKLFDLFFLPHFNQPYNYITMAALNAE